MEDTGNRAREEEGDALQPRTKRAMAEGGEVGEDGMETDGEWYLSGAAPMPALMQPFLSPLSVLAEVAMSVSISDTPSATATSEEDDEWKARFLKDCSEACDICWSLDKRKPQSQPMPDDDHLCRRHFLVLWARLSSCVDSSASRCILTHRKRNAWSENAS